jgi:hypothetical protein
MMCFKSKSHAGAGMLAAVGALLLAISANAAPDLPAATPSLDTYPRAAQAIQVQRGGQLVSCHP